MTPTPFLAPYRSAHSFAQAAKISLVLGTVINFLEVISTGIAQMFPEFTGDEDLGQNVGGTVVGLLRLALLLLSAAIYILTVVLFSMWLHRSKSNLRTFGYHRLDYSTAWSVGSFFVPFVSLVIPFRGVRELWEKSVPPEDTQFSVPTVPSSFYIWWTFWLLCGFAGNLAFRLERLDGISMQTLQIVGVISEVLTIVAGLLAFLVIGEIDQRQENTSQRLKLGKFVVPPPPMQFEPAQPI